MTENPIHLGEGAYVMWTNYGIIITANHHDPTFASDVISIEDDAMEKLIKWYADMKKDRQDD